MRRNFEEMTNEEAYQIIDDSFKVLFARYKYASSSVDLVTVTKDQVSKHRIQVKVNFSLNGFVNKEDIM